MNKKQVKILTIERRVSFNPNKSKPQIIIKVMKEFLHNLNMILIEYK